MKHMTTVSKACIGDPDHPSLCDSIFGLLEDPVGAVLAHLCKDKEPQVS